MVRGDIPDDIDGIEQDRKSKITGADTLSMEQSNTLAGIPLKSYWQRMSLFTTASGGSSALFIHIYRPFILLFTFPGVAFVALVYGSQLAWLAILLNVQAIYFTLPPYNFSSSGVGLLNIPTFIGSILGGFFGGQLSDYSIQWLARRNGGVYEPEMRLWLALPTILITPAGYFMFGLSVPQAGYTNLLGLRDVAADRLYRACHGISPLLAWESLALEAQPWAMFALYISWTRTEM